MIAPVVMEATRDRHPERTRGGRSCAPTRTSRRFLTLAAVMLAATMALVGAATAAARPSCMGHKATKVGNRHGNHIKGTHHRDVIAALGGRDVIISNGGRDVICGGGGNDRIIGGSHPSRLRRDDPSKLIGGPGNDYILGGYDNDFIVGDNAKVSANAIGHVGKDKLDGDYGHDFIVGDNYSSSTPRAGSTTSPRPEAERHADRGQRRVGQWHRERRGQRPLRVHVGQGLRRRGQLFALREGGRRGKGQHQCRAEERLRRRRQLHEDRAAIGSGRDQMHGRPGPTPNTATITPSTPRADLRAANTTFSPAQGASTTCSAGLAGTPATAVTVTTTPRDSASMCWRSPKPSRRARGRRAD